MPGGRLGDRFTGAVVLCDQGASQHVAIDASREARLMLANQLLCRRRLSRELRGIEVPTAGNAVDVRLLLGPRARRQVFAFAFGEALLSLHRTGT